MKKLLVLWSFLLMGTVFGQIQENPVKWSYQLKQKGAEAELIFTATIEDGWHIYSQFTPDGGPVPTAFDFEKSENYDLVGKTVEPKPHVHFEDAFGIDVHDFDKKAVFKQKIKIKSSKDFEVKGELTFMVCNDKMCLPPEYIPFSFKVKGGGVSVETEVTEEAAATENVSVENADTTKASEGVKPVGWRVFPKRLSGNEFDIQIDATIDTNWVLLADSKELPLRFEFELPAGITKKGEMVIPESGEKKGWEYNARFSQRVFWDGADSTILSKAKVKVIYAARSGEKVAVLNEDFSLPVDLEKATQDGTAGASSSYLGIFLAAFLSGFLALLTPCVFPMIPMTVSFFLKTSKSKAKGISNALFYGSSIIVIYVTLGLAISGIFGSDALNALSTNVWFNIFFFVLLVFFALSFLGAFEIVLPASWVNAADKNADRGGMLGIFFMAFTLALVSFSCTGPIIGTLLVEASTQGGMGPFFGMFGFSLAIALPFTLFAIFPSWLNSMPQSGGWLNSVKVSLGFLELALAFKFLSNADLVVQAHLLEREVFLAIWIVVFALWGFYLLGKLKFSHDSDLPYISTPRLMLSVLVFTFVIYMLPGMWGAPLKWIAGFPPPQHYSESPYGVGGKAPEIKEGEELPEHSTYGPHQLVTFHDYDHAMEYARKVGKPVMVDFTGHACVNCRKMEENVWSAPEVLEHLRKDVVIASLHVDEKHKLPEPDQYVSAFDGKKIKTVGQKWSDFQKSKYNSNSQPMYLILDHAENTMNGSASFESHGDISTFSVWLKDGLQKFKEVSESPEYRPELVLK